MTTYESKMLLAWLIAAGITAGGAATVHISAADRKINPTKEQRDAAKAERTVVAVPEPSVLLLSALGTCSVLVGGWYFRERDQHTG